MTSITRLLAVALLTGCPSADPPDPGPPAEDLPPPDLSGVDLDEALVESVDFLTRTTGRAAWAGHLAALDRISAGCPTVWSGVPSGVGDVDGGEDGNGWQDSCSNGNVAYRGSVAWSTTANPDGPVIGTRTLAAIATVDEGEGELFRLRGAVEDSLRLDEGGARWTYSSTFNGAAGGSATVDPDLPAVAGWRGNTSVTWVGGARWSINVAANLAFDEDMVQGRFDALDVETYIPGPGANEMGCGQEPHGRISMRLPPGDWVDVQFWVPPPAESPEEIVTNDCDGCGSVTIRGVPLGDACPDFSLLWTAEQLPRAVLDDFVLPMREQISED